MKSQILSNRLMDSLYLKFVELTLQCPFFISYVLIVAFNFRTHYITIYETNQIPISIKPPGWPNGSRRFATIPIFQRTHFIIYLRGLLMFLNFSTAYNTGCTINKKIFSYHLHNYVECRRVTLFTLSVYYWKICGAVEYIVCCTY